MYNVRIIEYPNSYQVRLYSEMMYEKDDNSVRIDRFTGEVIERKRHKPNPENFQYVDYEWEDVELAFQEQREDYSRKAQVRAKNNLYYIARSNTWDWFVTLTLDSKKIDRYNYDECSKKIRKWFNHLKERKATVMYYLIVPEMHKDGAWHFHGLIGGADGLTFVDSGKRDEKGRVIYNFEDWKFGFSTATAVEDTERVSSYICKYITKDLCDATEGRQRYWVSKNCARAPISKDLVPENDMKNYIYGLYDKMTYKKRVQTEFMDIDYYEIKKGENNG